MAAQRYAPVRLACVICRGVIRDQAGCFLLLEPIGAGRVVGALHQGCLLDLESDASPPHSGADPWPARLPEAKLARYWLYNARGRVPPLKETLGRAMAPGSSRGDHKTRNDTDLRQCLAMRPAAAGPDPATVSGFLGSLSYLRALAPFVERRARALQSAAASADSLPELHFVRGNWVFSDIVHEWLAGLVALFRQALEGAGCPSWSQPREAGSCLAALLDLHDLAAGVVAPSATLVGVGAAWQLPPERGGTQPAAQAPPAALVDAVFYARRRDLLRWAYEVLAGDFSEGVALSALLAWARPDEEELGVHGLGCLQGEGGGAPGERPPSASLMAAVQDVAAERLQTNVRYRLLSSSFRNGPARIGHEAFDREAALQLLREQRAKAALSSCQRWKPRAERPG